MSGPKRADVVKALNVVAENEKRCAARIAAAESVTVQSLAGRTQERAREASESVRRASDIAAGYDTDTLRVCGPAASAVRSAAQAARDTADRATSAVTRAMGVVENAQQVEAQANTRLEEASAQYQAARDALASVKGDHYMHGPMEQAKQARTLYEEAARLLERAAKERKEAKKQLEKALEEANNAASQAAAVVARAEGVREEARVVLAAEEEARRITEARRRDALTRMGVARAALARVAALPHEKFAPTVLLGLEARLRAAEDAARMGMGDFGNAASEAVLADAERAASDVAQAQAAWERRRDAAVTGVALLDAALAGVSDPAFIREWADDRDALDRATVTRETVNAHVRAERFEDAVGAAESARNAVTAAIESAARNHSLDQQRTETAEAVVDVLNDLGFQVGDEPGNRTQAYRIVGQMPGLDETGDILIELPLEGEVHFEVRHEAGDASCVASVRALQERLRDRGVEWNVTHWGHAEGVNTTARKVNETVVTTVETVQGEVTVS